MVRNQSLRQQPDVELTSGTPIPPLESGDRLGRYEFERRYQALPHVKKAELIEGVVYVASGLWLAQTALLSGNMTQAIAVLQAGLNSPEHGEFVKHLSYNS